MIATMTGGIQPHNERPATVWSAGGKDYDEISRGISDAIEHCVRRLNPQPGERILDLSTGTGWTSRVVARRGAMVIGADIAGDLLDAARARADAEALPIDYQIGDAESLPFEDGEFDAVVSTFGVMFASRPEAAAAELARVCRKGGRIALTTWFSDGSVFNMFQVMRRYMPPPPSRRSAVAVRVGPHRAHPGAARKRVPACDFEMGISYYREPSGEAAWETFSKGYGPTRALAASLDPARREALRREFAGFHAEFPTELGICVPRRVLADDRRANLVPIARPGCRSRGADW